MKSTDKKTKELILPSVIGYARKYKCDLVIFECPNCGADFMLKSKADKSGIKGITIIYGEKEITAIYENKTVKKFETVLGKEEKPVKKKVVKNEKVDKTEDQPAEVQDKDEQL